VDAFLLLERSIEQGATVAAIGPFTNLALLEQRSPGILRDTHLFLMGGYVLPPRDGFPQWGPDMDYNVQVDVESAACVLLRANPTLVPLSVTVETAFRRSYLPALRKAGRMGQLLARQAEAYALDEGREARFGETCDCLPRDIINFLHDPLACAIALGWSEGVEIREMPLKSEIKDRQLHLVVDITGKPTRVVTRVNGPAFSESWLRTVTRERPHAQG
jgi:purine nucleosidase